jgi:hypothetical protein
LPATPNEEKSNGIGSRRLLSLYYDLAVASLRQFERFAFFDFEQLDDFLSKRGSGDGVLLWVHAKVQWSVLKAGDNRPAVSEMDAGA